MASQKGTADIVFSATGGAIIAGIIVSARNQVTGEVIEIPANTGFAAGAIFFNAKNECECEVIIKTSSPGLARGASVTIGGIAGCLVTETERMWSNKDVQKYRVKATKYAGF